jgi:D-alanyl-D-alanine carboxypeptidase (penicillin-binding protein 5/6)
MRRILLTLTTLILLAAVAGLNYLRPVDPVPATQIIPATMRVPGQPPDLPWPAGEAAIGVVGIGLVASHGDDSARPMASIAKVVTALVIVADHPLKPIDAGDAVTVTAADVATYDQDAAAGQSVVAVQEGEVLNERQLLEGLLIPSGNNIADILARWDAGSLDAFVAKLNARASELGMRKTHFADASGFSDQTVGTPSDLVLAGEALMANPTLAQVVGEAQSDLPVAGTVFNVDYALGSQGIIGIKTGSSPHAGACFLFAATAKVPGEPALMIGAVMDEPTLDDAFKASEALIPAVTAGLKLVPGVGADQAVAEYRSPWGSRTGLRAQKDIFFVGWPGLIVHRRVSAPAAKPPLTDGEAAGTVSAWIGSGPSQSVALATDGPLFEPGNFWRLTRPLSDAR